MKRGMLAAVLALVMLATRGAGQTPIVVPAASAPAQAQVRAAVAADPNESAKILQQLQQIKGANEQTIRKQEALLQQLDELQKTAEQLRIFASRS